MNEYIQIGQMVLNMLIIPVLGYVIRLERRIAKLEAYIDMITKTWNGKERRNIA